MSRALFLSAYILRRKFMKKSQTSIGFSAFFMKCGKINTKIRFLRQQAEINIRYYHIGKYVLYEESHIKRYG